MKIISGIYKGRNLKGFTIDGTRPTMDRVKESLFATIQDYIKDSIILDLFAGSGNLGIEALSNNAKYAYLVDYNYEAIKIIKENISNLKIENCEVIKQDFKKALDDFSKDNKRFDIIFLDPPYKTDYIEKSLKLIEKNNLLANNGLIICESNSLDKIIYSSNFKNIKTKKYGDKWVVILKQM